MNCDVTFGVVSYCKFWIYWVGVNTKFRSIGRLKPRVFLFSRSTGSLKSTVFYSQELTPLNKLFLILQINWFRKFVRFLISRSIGSLKSTGFFILHLYWLLLINSYLILQINWILNIDSFLILKINWFLKIDILLFYRSTCSLKSTVFHSPVNWYLWNDTFLFSRSFVSLKSKVFYSPDQLAPLNHQTSIFRIIWFLKIDGFLSSRKTGTLNSTLFSSDQLET